MKALALTKPGKIDHLEITDLPIPEPKETEVRIKVKAAGVNPVDYKLSENGLPEWEFPHVPGLDVSGIVDKVSPNLSDWKEGDEVYGHISMTDNGAFAEYVTVPADVIAPLPSGWSHEEAASLPTAALTAYQSLYRKVAVQNGQTILIQAGAGGVGGYAIQLASLAGLHIITTCSPENNEYVSGLGAHKTIDYHTENVTEAIHKYTDGRGVDIVLDTIGDKTATEAIDFLAFNGHLVCIAALPDFTQYTPKTLAPSFHEVALGFVYRSDDLEQRADLGRMARELGALASQRKIKPLPQEIISLEEVVSALHRIKDGHVRGKIVAAL